MFPLFTFLFWSPSVVSGTYMLINSDRACVIRISQNFLSITFSPSNAVTKPTLIITPVTYCHGRQAILDDGAGGEASSILGFCLQRKGRESTQGTSQTDSFGNWERNLSQGTSNHLFEMVTVRSDSFRHEWSWVARDTVSWGNRCLQPLPLPKGSARIPAGARYLGQRQGTTAELPRRCQLAAQDSEMVRYGPAFGNSWLTYEQHF